MGQVPSLYSERANRRLSARSRHCEPSHAIEWTRSPYTPREMLGDCGCMSYSSGSNLRRAPIANGVQLRWIA